MRDRNIFDLNGAEKWLNEYLLTKRFADSNRLLNTTKLTDLIYSGFENENFDLNNNGINADSLSRDTFAALFSPVIKRKNEESISLKERLLNKPVFDKFLTDARFDLLKKYCEDKELTSFYASKAFSKTLADILLSNPFSPKTDYFKVIQVLENQIKNLVRQIKNISGSKENTDKLLNLYKKIMAKNSQIENLKVKAKKEAICYVQTIEDAFNSAYEEAIIAAVETSSIMNAWGSDSGNMKNTPVNRELLAHVKNSSELQNIAKSLGKYREMMLDKRKNGYSYGLGEKYDITTGNSINDCLSSEIALLGTPETEILFIRKYEQKQLLQYRKRTQTVKGKGDMIVLVDESSSTRDVQAWAKAFALALLDIAAKDKRKFAMIHFASRDNVKVDLFEPGKYFSGDVISAAEQFFGGGTDFEAPLTKATELLKKGFENADITIITDGECRISDSFAENFRNELRKSKASITGILLDKDNPCGESLEPFCDKIYHSKELTEDEIAVDILNKKVG